MYELRVLTGLHRGAALPLIGKQWLIGADKASDLTLMDPGVKPMHCQLVMKGGQYHLRSRRGTVTDNEGHQVASIDTVKAGEPFALAGTWLTLEDSAAPWPENYAELIPNIPAQSKPTLTPTFWAICAAAALATTGALASLESDKPPAAATPAAAVTKNTQPPSRPADSFKEPGKIALETRQEVKLTLLNMLRERELDALVRVHDDEEGIYLSGEVAKEKLPLVRRMLNRLTLNFDVLVPIENRVKEKRHTLPFKIVQITSGPLAHVVTDKGRRLFVGDELDGIRLVAIEKNQITFDGAQKFEVKW